MFAWLVHDLPPTPGLVYLALGFDLTHWNSTLLPLDLDLLGAPGCRLWIAPEPGLSVCHAH